MGASKAKTNRELLILLYNSLNGDGNGNEGFYKYTKRKLDELQNQVEDVKQHKKDSCPYGPTIEEVASYVRQRKDPREKREWIKTFMPLIAASVPGLVAILLVLFGGE